MISTVPGLSPMSCSNEKRCDKVSLSFNCEDPYSNNVHK